MNNIMARFNSYDQITSTQQNNLQTNDDDDDDENNFKELTNEDFFGDLNDRQDEDNELLYLDHITVPTVTVQYSSPAAKIQVDLPKEETLVEEFTDSSFWRRTTLVSDEDIESLLSDYE